jgi:hypothetical protein
LVFGGRDRDLRADGGIRVEGGLDLEVIEATFRREDDGEEGLFVGHSCDQTLSVCRRECRIVHKHRFRFGLRLRLRFGFLGDDNRFRFRLLDWFRFRLLDGFGFRFFDGLWDDLGLFDRLRDNRFGFLDGLRDNRFRFLDRLRFRFRLRFFLPGGDRLAIGVLGGCAIVADVCDDTHLVDSRVHHLCIMKRKKG